MKKIWNVLFFGAVGALAFYVYFKTLMAIPQEVLVTLILITVIFIYWLERSRNK